MRKIRLPLLVIALSLMTGMAYAIDIPQISTWTQAMGVGGGNSPGFGDLLIGPLYDVRNLTNPDTGEGTIFPTTQQTLINLVNTDDSFGVIARIRFREWKRSDEVLDFDIPLSCNDVWTAEVSRNVNGGGHIAGGSPLDRWINGPIDPQNRFPSAPLTGLDFAISDIPNDAVTTSTAQKLLRTENGYFEVIGEERVACKMDVNGLWHRSLGDCVIVGGITFCPPSDKDVKNTLMGTVFLIRPEGAQSHQYNMEAFSNFAVDPVGIFSPPTTRLPDLFTSVQGGPGNTGQNVGIGGFNQLEAIMSKRFVDFQYVDGIDAVSNTPQATSVVITFPTKHFHYGPASTFTLGGVAGGPPFTGPKETGTEGSGEVFVATIFDRDENTFRPPNIPISPPTTSGQTLLPWEVNIIGLLPEDPLPDPFARGWRDNFLIATKNTASGQTFLSGWGEIDLSPPLISGDVRTGGATQGKANIVFNFMSNIFPTGPVAVAGQGFPAANLPGAYRGLPALGIVMTEFFNDSINGYYGNTVPWQFGVQWGVLPGTAIGQ